MSTEHIQTTPTRGFSLAYLLAGVACISLSFFLSQQNFLLFHSLAEGVSIVVACSLLLVLWNARDFLEDDFLLLLGVAYLFVAILDMLHTFSYKGMGILAGDSANPATQLWIAARYLQSASLLFAPWVIGRKLRAERVILLYATITTLLLCSIFIWENFPVCFVDGQGLTSFKVNSEYIIIGVLIAAALGLWQKREQLDKKVIHLLIASILLTICAELAFTFYVSVYGFSNLVGHIFKIISFYLIYKAIVITAIRKPQLLFYQQTQENADRYQQMFQQNTAMKLLIDPETGLIIDANNAACDFYQYSKEQLLTMNINEINPLPSEDLHQKRHQAQTGEKGYFLFRHRLASGELRDVEVYSGPITVRGKTLLFSIIHDISQRIKLRESLLINEKRLRTLLHFNEMEDATEKEIVDVALEEAVSITGSQIGYFHFIHNDQINLQLFTWSKNVFKECTASDERMYPLKEAGVWADCVRTGQPVIHNDYQRMDDKNGYPEGHTHIDRHMSVPIFQKDKMIAIIGVGNKGEDYTDEDVNQLTLLAQGVWRVIQRIRAAEEKVKLVAQLQQAQKMDAIGTLAGGIAHDFNNLLAIIRGNLDIIQGKNITGGTTEKNIEHMKIATGRATERVKQILAFSRQEEQLLVPTNLTLAVTESIGLLRSTIPTTIEIMGPVASHSISINANMTQLQQVVMNLCSNAVHAIGEKGLLKITLEEVDLGAHEVPAETAQQAGRYAKLSIIDSGCGMSPETLGKIFDPFFTTKGVGKGTGMGLSMVHGIVEQFGGFIRVESTLGQGTTFDLYFRTVAEIALDARQEQTATVPSHGARILFVDDEMQIVEMSKELLEKQGYQTTCLTSSIRALEIFKANPDAFDLVITDQTMPEMTGLELTSKLLEIRPNIPIIICSGYSSTITEVVAKKTGAREFCMKPLGAEQLFRVVTKVLADGKHSAQSI